MSAASPKSTAKSTATDSPFSARVIAIGVPVIMLSLVATLLAGVFGPELFEPTDVEPSAFSRSALGHRAFVALLEELGIETEVSRARSGQKARNQGVLLIAEPRPVPDEEGEDQLSFMRDLDAQVSIVVLPKRTATQSQANRKFAEQTSEVAEMRVREVLTELTDWTGTDDEWEIERRLIQPTGWKGTFQSVPHLERPQLVSHPDLEPWVYTDQGTLIGELDGLGDRRIIVVSDPDLIANHGLWPNDGANAKVAIELIELLLTKGERVIIDESCHGSGSRGGFWREVMRFPLLLIVLQCALLFFVVIWSALGRFGPPIEEQIGLEAGSRRLVDSTAELMRFGRHRGLVARKYLLLAIDAACARLHGPATGTVSERVAWLAEREKSHGKLRITRLVERAQVLGSRGSEEEIRELALAIDRWRWEIVNGSEGDRSGR